jgi:hypothetical protein
VLHRKSALAAIVLSSTALAGFPAIGSSAAEVTSISLAGVGANGWWYQTVSVDDVSAAELTDPDGLSLTKFRGRIACVTTNIIVTEQQTSEWLVAYSNPVGDPFLIFSQIDEIDPPASRAQIYPIVFTQANVVSVRLNSWPYAEYVRCRLENLLP